MKIILKLLFLILPIFSFAQNDREIMKIYSDLAKVPDSLYKIGQISRFNEKEAFEIAKKLDTQYPMEYEKAVTNLLLENKYNEASFIYFLGKARAKDLDDNGTLGHYGTDFNALSEEVLFYYLSYDIENFKNILIKAKYYYEMFPYVYMKDAKKYKKALYLKENDDLLKKIVDTPDEFAKSGLDYRAEVDKNLKGLLIMMKYKK